ncbi:MAG: DMT family transporter [Candidatus Heimdallarchaeota archaeon]|nr:DMT family transporter [Candidatus Heimdallarchaeota archaeon]
MSTDKPSLTHRLLADVALLIITVIWGSTFFMVDQAIETISVMIFLAFRFTIALIVLLIVFSYQLFKFKVTWGAVWRGVIIGVFLFIGYGFQTFGMEIGTEPGKAAFITGLYVVLVPIFAALMLKKPPHYLSWIGIIVAVGGLALLSIDSFKLQFTDIFGDLLVFIGAFGYTFHIIFIDKYVEKIHYSSLVVFQTGTVAVLAWIFSAISWDESFTFSNAYFTNQVIFTIVFTGVIATALILAVQTFAQKKTTPTHVALIFTMEPVFGALFAYFFVYEIPTIRQWIGCALILASMIFQQLIEIYLNRCKTKKTNDMLIIEEPKMVE